MQGTVATFDPETRSGSVLLDDGLELDFAAPALAGTGLRLLRPGQRVRLKTRGPAAAGSGPGDIVRLQIATLP